MDIAGLTSRAQEKVEPTKAAPFGIKQSVTQQEQPNKSMSWFAKSNQGLVKNLSSTTTKQFDKTGKQITGALHEQNATLEKHGTLLKSISGLLDKTLRYQRERDLKQTPTFSSASWSRASNLESGLYRPDWMMQPNVAGGGFPGLGGFGSRGGRGGGRTGGRTPVPTGTRDRGRPTRGGTRVPTGERGPAGTRIPPRLPNEKPNRTRFPMPKPVQDTWDKVKEKVGKGPGRAPRPTRAGGRFGGLLSAGAAIGATLGLPSAIDAAVDYFNDGTAVPRGTERPEGMSLSSSGKTIIKKSEGLRLQTYTDTAGVPTIGYGHTGPDVYYGLTIDETTAERLLDDDVVEAEDDVRSAVKVPLTQDQFDALTSFTFNLGGGRLRESTLLRKLNSGDYEGAQNEFKKWVYSEGKVTAGLVTRRQEEAALFGSESSVSNTALAVAGTGIAATAVAGINPTTGFSGIGKGPVPSMPQTAFAGSQTASTTMSKAALPDIRDTPAGLSLPPKEPPKPKNTVKTRKVRNQPIRRVTGKPIPQELPKAAPAVTPKEPVPESKPTKKARSARTTSKLGLATPLLTAGLEGMYLKDVVADENMTIAEKAKEFGKSGTALAGAEIGAVAGATLGSAVPVVGTVVGGLVGGSLGYLGGSEYGGRAIDYLNEQVNEAGLSDAIGRTVAVPMSLFSEDARNALASDIKNSDIAGSVVAAKDKAGNFLQEKGKMVADYWSKPETVSTPSAGKTPGIVQDVSQIQKKTETNRESIIAKLQTIKQDIEKAQIKLNETVSTAATAGASVNRVRIQDAAFSPSVTVTSTGATPKLVQGQFEDDFFAPTKKKPQIQAVSTVDSTPREKYDPVKTVKTLEQKPVNFSPQQMPAQMSASYKPKIEDTKTIIDDGGLMAINLGIL